MKNDEMRESYEEENEYKILILKLELDKLVIPSVSLCGSETRSLKERDIKRIQLVLIELRYVLLRYSGPYE